ncbi:MAG: type II toxin-antitoxin system VapC family toxin [Acidobacteriota bacterium]|jgi:PIN domain nuclease of toxin-antitoxin system|nr:type II toxin-antitoxin system VapC family toxin [Acidobacteriota bacterium]
MKLLLDSHTFIWWRDETHKLSSTALTEISNPQNDVFLSVVTAWELQIKISLNKFSIKGGLGNAIKDEQQSNGFQILPVELSHALYLENLPPHHKDPFDRLLISQAIVENMSLISTDSSFGKYKVKLLW